MTAQHNRADRILIAIAMIILLMAGGAFYFDAWMWGGKRSRGDRIGKINSKSGDVRIKFMGDLRWHRAAQGQDLVFNDAIYVGDGAKAHMALGKSDLSVTENTLVVLRREKEINFLNLNYGTILGNIVGNEKIRIDTGDGEPIDLTSDSKAQILLSKKGGRTELSVISGQADVVVNGKKQSLNTSSKVVLGGKKQRVETVKLKALEPLKDNVIFSAEPTEIAFKWEWGNRRQPTPKEKYTLEFSADPSFQRIHARKVVTGMHTSTMAVSRSLNLYYRVRGQQNELSQTERVNFVRMWPPVIVKPVAGQETITAPGRNAVLELELRVEKSSAVPDFRYQIATDADFANVISEQKTRDQFRYLELGKGQYYARARSEYDDSQQSLWSQTTSFQIKEQLHQQLLSNLPDFDRVLIPNRNYPAHLYQAANAQVSAHLRQKGLLNNYLPLEPGSFEEVTLHFEGEREPIKQTGTQWPQQNLVPGDYVYKYQVTKRGYAPSTFSPTKRVQIRMEPPRRVGSVQFEPPQDNGNRYAQWKFTSLLFARSYDIELAHNSSFSGARRFSVKQAKVRTLLGPGSYFWRARARDEKGQIISEFSEPHKIIVPEAIPQHSLAKASEPEEPEIRREPAVEGSSVVARIENEKGNTWVRNGWWAWVGSGLNYIDYRQSVQRGTLKAHSGETPTKYVELGFDGRRGWGGAFTYKETPGEISIPSAQIDNGSYTWTSTAIEGLLRKKIQFLKLPASFGARVGVQQHKTPLVFLDGDTNLQLKRNTMQTISLGVLGELVHRKWTHHWLMRYQYPFSSQAEGSNRFEIEPTFAFDGSVGTSYNLTQQLRLGIFWYGQWHQFNFVYSDSEVTNVGFQSLFYSNLDLRLGFEF